MWIEGILIWTVHFDICRLITDYLAIKERSQSKFNLGTDID